jgi:hypothetical protein
MSLLSTQNDALRLLEALGSFGLFVGRRCAVGGGAPVNAVQHRYAAGDERQGGEVGHVKRVRRGAGGCEG